MADDGLRVRVPLPFRFILIRLLWRLFLCPFGLHLFESTGSIFFYMNCVACSYSFRGQINYKDK